MFGVKIRVEGKELGVFTLIEVYIVLGLLYVVSWYWLRKLVLLLHRRGE